jgi:hypothetical protein
MTFLLQVKMVMEYGDSQLLASQIKSVCVCSATRRSDIVQDYGSDCRKASTATTATTSRTPPPPNSQPPTCTPTQAASRDQTKRARKSSRTFENVCVCGLAVSLLSQKSESRAGRQPTPTQSSHCCIHCCTQTHNHPNTQSPTSVANSQSPASYTSKHTHTATASITPQRSLSRNNLRLTAHRP